MLWLRVSELLANGGKRCTSDAHDMLHRSLLKLTPPIRCLHHAEVQRDGPTNYDGVYDEQRHQRWNRRRSDDKQRQRRTGGYIPRPLRRNSATPSDGGVRDKRATSSIDKHRSRPPSFMRL